MAVGLTLEQVRPRILELARRIEAPEELLPTFGYSDGSGGPSIEARGGGLAYMVREGGRIFEDWWVSTEDELLYWVFRDVTFTMAAEWERHHRVQGEDSRRGLFLKQLELMRTLSPAWEDQLRREKASVLAQLGLA